MAGVMLEAQKKVLNFLVYKKNLIFLVACVVRV